MSKEWQNLVRLTVSRQNGIVVHEFDVNEAKFDSLFRKVIKYVTAITAPLIGMLTLAYGLLKLLGV